MEIKIEQKKGIFRTAIEYFRYFAKVFEEDNIDNMEESFEDIAKGAGYDPKEIEALQTTINSVATEAEKTTVADFGRDSEDEEEITKKKKTPFWKKSEEPKVEKANDENSLQTEYSEDAQALLNRVNKSKSKGEERE